MDLSRSTKPATSTPADAIVVGVRAGRKLSGAAAQIDKALGGELSAHLDAVGFKPKVGKVETIRTFGRIPASVVLAAGLGEDRVTHDEVRKASGAAARASSNYPTVALEVSNGVSGGVQAAVEGFLMGSYRFTKYKSDAEPTRTASVLLPSGSDRKALDRGRAVAEAVIWARDLVNEPAGNRGPAEFAELARARAHDAGLEVEILDEKKLERKGMNGILTVGQGSASPPRFLTLTYSPRRARGFVGAVGKGITFDSGGLSIKTAEGMETMKTDCSGAAAVVAAMTALPALGPRIKVVAAIPLAENMPGGRAVKPGDVIRHYGGRTSEVLNTDAEGRLVLADALAWMSEQKPDAMIDFATLTGGMVIALGREVAGYFANRTDLAREVERASQRSGEPVWQMPLIDDLRRELDSEVADIKNTGGRWGSPVFGGLFLRDFVGDTPWIHVDIAGPARSEKDRFYLAKGASGFGTRLLIEWIEGRASK